MEAIGSASFLLVLRPPEDDAPGVPAGIRASDARWSLEVPLDRGARLWRWCQRQRGLGGPRLGSASPHRPVCPSLG